MNEKLETYKSMPLASLSPASSPANSYQNYDILRIYAYYRTLLSGLLWAMFSSELAPNVLGTHHPKLFFYTVLTYTLLNCFTLILFWKRKINPKTGPIFALLFIDICAITLMLHASGGVQSGLGYLLVICVAAGSIFISGQINIALAALASLLVIVQTVANAKVGHSTGKELFSAGSLGIILFVTALVFQYLTNKIRSSNQQAVEQTQHAVHLERLANLIVERMRTGILVVNNNNLIELHNKSAARLLGLTANTQLCSRYLNEFPQLENHLKIWRAYPHSRSPYITTDSAGQGVRISFAQLEPHEDSDILIFIEDTRLVAQEAQQLKLASLGRLTASIAHEIRNPLGAISHASQLLNESTDIKTGDRRLTQIIQKHSQRVNQIIENVLQLSRRKPVQATPFLIDDYLASFTNELSVEKQARIELVLEQTNLKSKFDPSQLNQVLTNLCENGLRYSFEHSGDRHLCVAAGIDKVSELPYIDIIDDGKGISEKNAPHIFEPFFTTEATGSGLGLYISKELCEANQASLNYRITNSGKSCFRINLAHHQRIF